MTSPACHSRIYVGTVRHRRFRPVRNEFRYRIFMLYLDLAELPEVLDGHLLCSARHPAPARFRRREYHGPPDVPLDRAVRDTVERETGFRPGGPIRMLTHLRYFGFVFNPVSFYYCFDETGTVPDVILAEITNTPWKERHSYALDCRAQAAAGNRFYRFSFPKRFHVSPFMPMTVDYEWSLRAPGPVLSVHMADFIGGEKTFDATLGLHERPISGGMLAKVLFGYPLMTLKVVSAIHWQALKLYLKRCPFHVHPKFREAGQEGGG